jgi:hypothetical protein
LVIGSALDGERRVLPGHVPREVLERPVAARADAGGDALLRPRVSALLSGRTTLLTLGLDLIAALVTVKLRWPVERNGVEPASERQPVFVYRVHP